MTSPCHEECYKTKKWIIYITLIVNSAFLVFLLLYTFIPFGSDSGSSFDGTISFEYVEHGQYVLHIGLNDKDTYEQIIPTDEAVNIVNAICAKYISGWTSSHARGGWIDEKAVLTQENTLVYFIAHAAEADVIAIMDEVLVALNQNAILVERRNVSSAFYRGRSE